MEPPSSLICQLKPYQKQALYWMSEAERGLDAEKAAETLHPCWAAYRICDEYVNSSKTWTSAHHKFCHVATRFFTVNLITWYLTKPPWSRRASSIYLNIFSGEATTQFPTATQMARGGVSFVYIYPIKKSYGTDIHLSRIRDGLGPS